MTSARQTLTLPTAGYSQTVQAYLWGAGGGAGGSDGTRQGGAGSGGGYVSAQFTVNPGDVVEIAVGASGSSGVNSSVANAYETPIFSTRTAIPIGRTTPLPRASTTNVARWSKFLNDTGVWNTGTAVNGSTTSLANTLNFDQSYTVFFELSITYVFNLAAYYEATVFLDGEVLFESGLNSWTTQETGGSRLVVPVTPGNHTIRIRANANAGASYGVFGVGLTIATAGNAGFGGYGLVRNVFDTRSAVASPPLSIPTFIVDSTNIYSNLMFDFGMWEAEPKATSCSRTYANVYFPYTGVYQVEMSAANTATLSIDGAVVYTTPGNDSYSTAYTTDVTVSQGYHTVSFSASFSQTALPSAGVAIVISKSWSGATGGLAGPVGTSGGGGGSGGCTTLVLNPRTPNETLIAVAVGGAGGGGAGNSDGGIGEATAPGPRGRTAAGVSSPQTGQNQGDFYKDGGGGGAGGPGGPGGAGLNGYSSEGDAYAQAGSVGLSYLNPIATGAVVNPTNITVAFQGPYYDLLPGVGRGGGPGSLQGNDGGAVFIFNSFGPRVRNAAGWQEVKTIFVNVNGEWKQIDGMYVNEAGVWEPVVGTFVPTFESQADDWGRVGRVPDRRALPPPPKPVVYDTFRNCCCFVAGTLIAMADGSTKAIEDVALGDVVLGKDGAHNTVLEFLRPTLGETGATLMAFNGGKPFMASDHPVFVKGQGWKSFDPEMTYSKYSMTVGQYQVGDVIETQDGAGFAIDSIEEYSDQAPDQIIYNFTLNGNNTYIADNLVVHNKGGGCCCFVAGTLITMADGSTKAIEDVALGESILGKDGAHNTVLEFLRPTLGETGATLIAFNSGAPFMASDHPVFVKGQGWKSFDPKMTYRKYSMTVGQYQVGDVIETQDGVGFEIHSIEEYNDQDSDQIIYNFVLDGNHTYIANNLVVHNKGGAGGCGGAGGGGGGGGGCCCCFVAGTLITMADGSYKCIEDVALGDVVLGKDGTHNTVLEFLRPTLGETGATLMAFNSGVPFMASDHPVWVRNEGWKSYDPAMTYDKYGIVVSQYKVGDVIETQDGAGFAIDSIEEYNNQDLTQIIYNIKVTGNNTYVANKLVVHNKSDARLKRNIELIETRSDGLRIYSFNYIWSDVTWIGVMAQDLLEQPQFAHAVQMDADGFYSVDYSKINFEMVRADMYCVEI